MINSITSVDNITIQSSKDKTSRFQSSDKMIKENTVNEIKLSMDINEDNLTRAIESVNKDFMAENRRLEYSYHEETNEYVIKIVDNKTNEVIKQIPSQKLLDYAAGLVEYISLYIDKKV